MSSKEQLGALGGLLHSSGRRAGGLVPALGKPSAWRGMECKCKSPQLASENTGVRSMEGSEGPHGTQVVGVSREQQSHSCVLKKEL
jgi:hypothetical protein